MPKQSGNVSDAGDLIVYGEHFQFEQAGDFITGELLGWIEVNVRRPEGAKRTREFYLYDGQSVIRFHTAKQLKVLEYLPFPFPVKITFTGTASGTAQYRIELPSSDFHEQVKAIVRGLPSGRRFEDSADSNDMGD